MATKTIAVLAATGAIAAAGCGGDDAGPSASTTTREPAKQAGTPATTSTSELSPQAQATVTRGQNLAADVWQLLTDWSRGDLTTQQALDRLDAQQQRADALQADARDVPESDSASEQVTTLANQIQRSVARARRDARSGNADAAQQAADDLRVAARTTLTDLRAQLPEDARSQLDGVLSQLGS